MTILLIDNYDSFTFNLVQCLQAQTEEPLQVFRNDGINWPDVSALRPSRVVLSPGPGHPARTRDFGVCQDILANHLILGCPILGVCLGHQGLALQFGATLEQAPDIVHGKTDAIHILKPSPLFEGLPNPFQAMRYHSWVVSSQNFPEELVITAEAQGLIMAIEHRKQPLYGVQFHPESIGTPEGKQMLQNFLRLAPIPQIR